MVELTRPPGWPIIGIVERGTVGKALAAERTLSGLRTLVVATNVFLYEVLLGAPGHRLVAHVTMGVAAVYSLWIFVAAPFRRWPVLVSGYVTAVVDAVLLIAWIFATGGIDSPFHVMLYPTIVTVAYRYTTRETILAAVLYGGGYVDVAAVLGQVAGHGAELALRVVYVAFSAMLGVFVARQAARLDRLRAEALEEALHLRNLLLSSASHEIKGPLTTLKIQSQLLREAMPGDRERQRLLSMDAHLEHMNRLVNQLLDVSRLEDGRLPLRPEPLDLGTLVAEVVGRFDDALREAGCEVMIDRTGDLRGAWDRLRLESILTNLLANAMKYGKGKPITIAVVDDGERVRVRVRDRGVGIAPSAQGRLFHRFVRAAPDEPFRGHGLGLWIARAFAESMGGTITVDSAPGQGSTFTVLLRRTLEASAGHPPIPAAG